MWSFPEEGTFVGGRFWRVTTADITVVILGGVIGSAMECEPSCNWHEIGSVGLVCH